MATSNQKPVKTVTIDYTDPAPGQSTQLEIINDPGGNVGEVQFKSKGGTFGGSNSFVWNETTGNLGVRGNIRVTGNISGNIYASSTNLKIVGGTSGDVLVTDGTGNLTWVSLQDAGGYGNSEVANYLPTFEGELSAGNANLGNTVTANFFVGDGSQLTGLPAGYANSNVANYLPTYTGNVQAGNLLFTNNTVQNTAWTGTVDVANVTGLGNITTIDLDGSNSNVLYGNGMFAAISSINPFDQDLNTTDNVQFANITSTDAIRFENAGNLVGALGYAPTHIGIESYGSNSVYLTTNDFNTWAFNSDGTLSLPGNVAGESGNVLIDSADDNFEVRGAQAVNFEANTVVNIYTDTSNNAYQWQFGDDGNLTLPGNSSSINYANGTPYGGGGSGYIIPYEVSTFVANTQPGFGEIQFADNEGANSAPATAQKLFINESPTNEQSLGTIFQQWTSNSYRGTLSLNNGSDSQATFNISNGRIYFEPETYRGFNAGLNQIWGDDCSINQLIITNATAPNFYNTDFLVEEDVFHASGLATGNTHVMLNIYGSSQYNPINTNDLWNTFVAFVDNVLYDGETLRTNPDDIKTQFYNNAGSFRNNIPTQDLFQYFRFTSSSDADYFGTAPTTTNGSGTGATVRIRVNPNNTYTVLGTALPGVGYIGGETLTVLGTDLGGATPTNDLTILIDSVDGDGVITAVSYDSGTGVYPWPTNRISDGGDDQYDTGNYLNTNLASEISYANGITQTASAAFGGGDYCVMYYQSFFCMVATGVSSSVSDLFYSGNLGFDGDGLLNWTGLRGNQDVVANNNALYAYFDSEYLDGELTPTVGTTYNMVLDSAGINLDGFYAYNDPDSNDNYFGSNIDWRLESQSQLFVQSYNEMIIQTRVNQRGIGETGPALTIQAGDGSPGQQEINEVAGNGGTVYVRGGDAGSSDGIDSLGNTGGRVEISGGVGSGNSQAGNVEINGGEGNNSGSINLRTDYGSNSSGKITLNTGGNGTTNTWEFRPDGTTIVPTLTVDLHNGGNQQAQTLQFGDNTQQVIITGPTPEVDSNSQRLIIQGQRGNGQYSEGGDVYVWAGDADTYGGDIKIYAGDADNVSAGYGGYVNIEGGQGFNEGGYVRMTGGQSSNGAGATASVIGGYGNTSGGDANLQGGQGTVAGGNVNISAGYGSGGPGGNVTIVGGGSGNGVAEYGNINLTAGSTSWVFGNDGNLTLPGALIGSTPNNSGYLHWVGNSSGDGAGYTTMNLVPDDTRVGSDSYVILDPTGPDHIHIRAGGTQDSSSAQLYLGGENSHFSVGAGTDPTLYIKANGYQWTHGTDGNLTTPGSILPGTANTFDIGNGVNYFRDAYFSNNVVAESFTTTDGGLTHTGTAVGINADAGKDIYLVADAANVSWTFGASGNLTLPGNTYNLYYANGAIASPSLYQVTNQGNTTNVQVTFNNGTDSVGSGSGTIVVDGGIGVSGNIQAAGELHSGGNSVIAGHLFVGPGSDLLGLTNELLVLYHGGEGYVQGAILNSTANSSADWVAYGAGGDDAGGWVDMGFTGDSFDDANYTITGPGDGYVFAHGYDTLTPGGGNLVITTGDQGTTKDVVFGTGGFLATDVFARISHSNNSFELSRTGATITFPDGSIQNTAYTGGGSGGSNISNGNSNVDIATANGNVTIAAVGNTTMTITGTGANITGTANITGNVTPGNITFGSNAGQISFHTGAYISGNANSISRDGSIVLQPYTGNGSTFPGVVIGGAGRLIAPNGGVFQIFNSADVTFQVAIKSTLSTAATSTTTGALIIPGGAGLAGSIATGVGALLTGPTFTPLANTMAGFNSNVNSYTQVTIQNKSNGADATADYVLTADNGSDTVNYLDLGIINSGYDANTPTNSLGNIVFAADSYLYAQGNTGNSSQSGGNLAIGTTVPGKNVKIFAGGVNNSSIIANISNTGIAVNGNVTATNFSGNISITGNVTGTSPNVTLVAGSYSYTFDNTGILTLPSTSIGSGNEGGEIDFTKAPNSTLSGNSVVIDQYVDRIRFFESGGNVRGAYIDLSLAATGVGTLLNNRASGIVNAGVDVTLGNLKARIPTSGNRSLQVSTVSGTYSVYGSSVYNANGTVGGTTIVSGFAVSVTTTPAYLNAGNNFTTAGDSGSWTIMDTGAGLAWRITFIIGASFNNNLITIERLI